MVDQEENSALEAESIAHEQSLPEIFSKNLILIFAILFSTIFAAALLISNLRTLQKNKAVIWVLIFTITYLIATAAVMETLSLDPGYTLIANVLGAAVLNEYFWNKYIGRDLEYKKRNWVKPAIISVGIVMLFAFLAFGSI